MKRTVKIFLILLSVLLILLAALLVYALSVTAGVRLDPEKLLPSSPCVTVLDKDGSPIPAMTTGERAGIRRMPEYLPNAFVAVEDKRFYSHNGLDFRRMLKAAGKNLLSFSFREGASTISQQLIKNTHLSGEKTLNRKLKEIKLARALEKRYEKPEILELYLNSIYFGHSAFGITGAAEFYFGKTPSELTPAESAMLAALVRSPNRYSPFRNPEACLKRRNFVLSLMAEQGYLSPEEADAAKAEPLPAEPARSRKENAFLHLVFDELSALFPDADSDDELTVYTSYDPEVQSSLEGANTDCDCCLLVEDAESGAIKALHSTCGILRRLPASTIKPLLVYAPALEENLISPATPILDEKVDFGGYSPANYGGGYSGYMSARYALAHSVNVPAVKLLNTLGVDRAAEYLKKMDLPVSDGDKTLALALGGMREGYPLPAIADGYATFARGGSFFPSHAIERVEGRGKVLFTSAPTPKKVFSQDVCALVNDMLQTAAREGTAKKLKALPFEVCAKTGTGGTDEGNTDAYTIAYTSEDVVAVWMGNRDNSPISATGGGAPAELALQTLNTLYRSHSPSDFPPCDEVVTVPLDKDEYEHNHKLLLADPIAPDSLALKELFRKGAIPHSGSTRFSHPQISQPQISVVNQSVRIVLCQTEYYDYVIKRACEGEVSVVYRGKYRKEFFDNTIRGGKTYVYSVTPYYLDICGETVTLPSVTIKKSSEIPDDWWND